MRTGSEAGGRRSVLGGMVTAVTGPRIGDRCPPKTACSVPGHGSRVAGASCGNVPSHAFSAMAVLDSFGCGPRFEFVRDGCLGLPIDAWLHRAAL
jgi:hypothetical protein